MRSARADWRRRARRGAIAASPYCRTRDGDGPSSLAELSAQRARIGAQRLPQARVVERGGGMIEREQPVADRPPVDLPDRGGRVEVLQRVAPQRDDQPWLDDRQLRVQPRPWWATSAARGSRLPGGRALTTLVMNTVVARAGPPRAAGRRAASRPARRTAARSRPRGRRAPRRRSPRARRAGPSPGTSWVQVAHGSLSQSRWPRISAAISSRVGTPLTIGADVSSRPLR